MNRAVGILSSACRGGRRRPLSARAGVARWLSSPACDEAGDAKRRIRDDGLSLADFVRSAGGGGGAHPNHHPPSEPRSGPPPSPSDIGDEFDEFDDAVITDAMSSGGGGEGAAARLGRQLVGSEQDELETFDGREASATRAVAHRGHHTLKFHLKTYGCQMNVNDTDIVRSILLDNHKRTLQGGDEGRGGSNEGDSPLLRFEEVQDEVQADVLLTNTCAIRDNAERKVWQRLHTLRAHDRNFPLDENGDAAKGDGLMGRTKEARKQAQAGRRGGRKRIIGVLGCMAERLKEDMFEQGTADVVVGPDAYRDLPRLISVLAAPSLPNHDGRDGDRGRLGAPSIPTERAVNVQLSLDETYASITPVRANPDDVSAFVSVMRGCNNMCSYCVVPFTRGRERSRDLESIVGETRRLLDEEDIKEVILLGQNVNSYHDRRGSKNSSSHNTYRTSNDGFSNMFRTRHGDGHRFADLLEAVSSLSPELRVRFTSPHPKDYPPELLGLMAERPNVCSHLHMPAQSGSSTVLERMRRGYSREAYLDLISDARSAIPGVSISSDFIAGFCGETEAEHLETLSLMEQVRYDQAFMFAYSMRGRTHAHRTMEDDVPEKVKARRLGEVIEVFRRNVQARNEEVEVGTTRLVLVEGESKRSTPENRVWSGRTDGNKRVVFDDGMIPTEEGTLAAAAMGGGDAVTVPRVRIGRGDYVAVRVTEARGHTLKADALCRSSVVGFEKLAAVEREERQLPLDVAL